MYLSDNVSDRYFSLGNCVRLGHNFTFKLKREEELHELLRRMDDFLMRGCTMHVNRKNY